MPSKNNKNSKSTFSKVLQKICNIDVQNEGGGLKAVSTILVWDDFLYGDDVDDRDYGDDVDDHDDRNGEVVDDQETNGIQFEDGGGSGSQREVG